MNSLDTNYDKLPSIEKAIDNQKQERSNIKQSISKYQYVLSKPITFAEWINQTQKNSGKYFNKKKFFLIKSLTF